jgi:hypothetical protein
VERSSAEEILASLSGREIVFRYFKDRYALQLLAYAAAEGKSLSEMRRGRFRPLLQKPSVRAILATRGGRGADWNLLDTWFSKPTEDYTLTFDLWGDVCDSTWYQTTRPGFNLVVQLNFPPAHDRAYRRYVEPRGDDPFTFEAHPIHSGGRNTLAWSRLDVDLERREALIEEIQSDWIRDAARAGESALVSLVVGDFEPPYWLEEVGCDALQLFRYVEHVLSNHRRWWFEAVLAASLWLLREQLGIRQIYMHTFDGGCRLKQMGGWRPPRSLYERVPRTFCFERVAEPPKFLRSHLGRSPELSGCEFWYLGI